MLTKRSILLSFILLFSVGNLVATEESFKQVFGSMTGSFFIKHASEVKEAFDKADISNPEELFYIHKVLEYDGTHYQIIGLSRLKNHAELWDTYKYICDQLGRLDQLRFENVESCKRCVKHTFASVSQLENNGFDESITITGNEQQEYYKVVLSAAGQIDELKEVANKTKHVTHGMMRLESGKMSSRTGDVITALSLLQELQDIARERAKESRAEDSELLAKQIAVAAIKFQILKGGSTKDIVFDKDRALSLEGDTGPYLQYTYARASAIIAKANEQRIVAMCDIARDPGNVMRILCRFPTVATRAQHELEPHYVANYLISVASLFNTWYAQEQIVDGTPAASHKVAITLAVATTIKNGLNLLGIDAPEKM